jgi:hypothetical protein
VVARLRANIEAVAGATLIGVFDHQAHVAAHPEGQIAPEIKDSKHVIFCLSNAIPNPLIAAVQCLPAAEAADAAGASEVAADKVVVGEGSDAVEVEG